MTSSRHCHRVHQNKAERVLCLSVLQRALWLVAVCVWEGWVTWWTGHQLTHTHTLITRMIPCCAFFFFSSSQEALLVCICCISLHSRWPALSEASLQRPSNHMTWVCTRECIEHWCVCATACVCARASLLVETGAKQFYYGSLTKGSLVLLFEFPLFFPPVW